MIAGETLNVVYRFRWRTERCMRAAHEIEQEIRRREHADRGGHGARTDDRAAHLAHLGVSPLAMPPDHPPYR